LSFISSTPPASDSASPWDTLRVWGLSPAHISEFLWFFETSSKSHRGPIELGRVISVHRGAFEVATSSAIVRASPPRRDGHDAPSVGSSIGVGDWVVVDTHLSRVVHRLERTSALVRQSAGDATVPQLIAANLDTVFVMTSANEDFSLRRLERYRHTIAQSGSVGVAVLSKSDLASDEAVTEMARRCSLVMPTVVISSQTGRGLGDLQPWLVPRLTIGIVGSSGVGKSTLVNRLLGEERQLVTALRESDATGRHTTTRRELVVLPNGVILLDTPGMRALRVWADDFDHHTDSPLAELASKCRFRDCRHRGEPGCAVIEAVVEGQVAVETLEVANQLERELAFQARRQDERLARAERDRWKAITKAQRVRSRASPKG